MPTADERPARLLAWHLPSVVAMRRVNVVGTSASGKSTMALALAERMGVPCSELDALHWEPNWTEAPEPTLRERVAAAIADDRWVVDGNYASVRDLVWARADTVVWLDYPLRTSSPATPSAPSGASHGARSCGAATVSASRCTC